MNANSLVFHLFKALLVVMIFLAQSLNVAAKDKDCWAEFFDDTQYTGKHFQLNEPAQLANLNAVNGENWAIRISSLKVGPKATVIIFDNENFRLSTTDMAKSPDLMRSWGITEKDIKEESELIFNANATIHDLSDFGFHQKVKSLKMKCN
ncbi:MAG: hypothetical protein HOP02_13885 [Methylococcaceae bacterium]|nr:hypothetical protein [Methylococcaceae bacterium]